MVDWADLTSDIQRTIFSNMGVCVTICSVIFVMALRHFKILTLQMAIAYKEKKHDALISSPLPQNTRLSIGRPFHCLSQCFYFSGTLICSSLYFAWIIKEWPWIWPLTLLLTSNCIDNPTNGFPIANLVESHVLLGIVGKLVENVYFVGYWRPSWRPCWISQIAQGYLLDISQIFIIGS